MKTTRRGFLGRALAGAAAVVAAPLAKPETAQAVEMSEQGRIKALVDDVLANPGKHPKIEARARELMGSSTTWGNAPGDMLTLAGTATWDGVAGAAGIPIPDPKPLGWQIESIIDDGVRLRRYGDTDLALRCLSCGWVGRWSKDISIDRVARNLWELNHHVTEQHDGALVNHETVWRPHDDDSGHSRIPRHQ